MNYLEYSQNLFAKSKSITNKRTNRICYPFER